MIKRIFHKADSRLRHGITFEKILDPELSEFCPTIYKKGVRIITRKFKEFKIKTLVINTSKYVLTIWKQFNTKQ